MRITFVASFLTISIAAALPIINVSRLTRQCRLELSSFKERAPGGGPIDPISALLGNNGLTMIKALPDKHIDPSPLGIDNIVSNLPIPGINLKRFLPLGLDGLLGVSQPAGTDGVIELVKGASGPLDGLGSIKSRHNGQLPMLDAINKRTPLANSKGLHGARSDLSTLHHGAHIHVSLSTTHPIVRIITDNRCRTIEVSAIEARKN